MGKGKHCCQSALVRTVSEDFYCQQLTLPYVRLLQEAIGEDIPFEDGDTR